MRLIVLSPFLKDGCLLCDLILLSTIDSIRLKLLFWLGRPAELDDVIEDAAASESWLDGVVLMAIGVILRAGGADLFAFGFSTILSLLA